jgi:hypothetical protein
MTSPAYAGTRAGAKTPARSLERSRPNSLGSVLRAGAQSYRNRPPMYYSRLQPLDPSENPDLWCDPQHNPDLGKWLD